MTPTRYLLLLCCGSLLAGCLRGGNSPPLFATPVTPAPAVDDPTIETRTASVSNGFITITVRLRRDIPGPRPVVITPVADHRWLLEAGVILVSFVEHWEVLRPLVPPPPPAGTKPTGPTYGKWLLTSRSPDLIGRGYFDFIKFSAVTALPQVIDYVVTLPEVDPRRLALSGHSTTGFAAFEAIANDHRFRVAAIVNACGDYHTFLQDSALALDRQLPLALEPTYDQKLTAREPIQHPEQFVKTALLLLNGENDPAVPFTCVQPTSAALQGAYRRHGAGARFSALSFPAQGHEISNRARAAMRAWWRRWLLPAALRRRVPLARDQELAPDQQPVEQPVPQRAAPEANDR